MSHGHSHGGAPCGGHGGGDHSVGPPAPASAIGSLFSACLSRPKHRPTPVPNYSQILSLCAGCGIVGQGMKRCGRCQVAYYCSPTCQERAWKEGHKATCVKGGEKLQDEIKQLTEEGVDMNTCIARIAKRDPQSPALMGVIKNLLMRHSNPEDSFELEDARQPEQQQGPPKPAPLLMALVQLGAGVNPQNASLNWILQPALQNFLLHDPIIDANQAYMRLRAQQNIFEKEQEQPGASWDAEAEAKELARFRADVQQDVAGPMFALLVLHLLATIARIPSGYGPLALRRLMFLAVNKVTVELIGPTVLPLLLQIMQSSRKQFFAEGGLACSLKGFTDEKQRGRGIWMTILCSVSPSDWFELGTTDLVAMTLAEIVVPGLCAGQFEDFYFMYSDPDPLENLGQGFKNGGKSRSAERSIGSSACGRGFDLFGIMLLERIVAAAQMWTNNSKLGPAPFFQALQVLTQENSPRAVACLFFVTEVLEPVAGMPATNPSSEVVKELIESRVPVSDPNYPQFVTQVFKTWRSLTFAEKKPYYMKAFSKQQLCEIENKTWVPPAVVEQKIPEAKDGKESSTSVGETSRKDAKSVSTGEVSQSIKNVKSSVDEAHEH